MKNMEISVVGYNHADEKVFARQQVKVGKLEAKELQQVANEKTLAKNLSTTRQKIVNLKKYEYTELEQLIVKHVNFMAKKRTATLCGYDATAIKRTAKDVNLYNFVDERGFNAVKCLSHLIGILDKETKDMQRKQEKELAKLSK